MIKTTGAEFWRFYNDDKFWPNGAWHDDTLVKVDGVVVEDYDRETIPDASRVEIDGGIIFLNEQGDESVDFERHFRKWRKAQDAESFVVECPKDKLEAVKAAIRAAGGRIA